MGNRNLNWQCHHVCPLRFSESGEPVHGSRDDPVHFNGHALLPPAVAP